ncbi:Las1-like-domain-containing protein [Lasiosphaeris hirsuta]|uniref:Las1-like-domain-containing protein n=1 Tax=Lasiosphaeris hirsuta TaxID=260670 RepID=A0AA40APX3_9PEZI|nr:Las1-like-domain-containing protein [Lasiosphaeris hirsuta]
MVQYVFTPWRERSELLTVRQHFYPERYPQSQQPSSQHRQDARQDADESEESLKIQLQRQFEDDNGTERDQIRKQKQHAVARVSVWMQRGRCPHLVESTALLTAAILSDRQLSLGLGSAFGSSSGSYAVRAAYSAAFSRFVTGLLDSHQDKARKMSMYGVAKSVGLPATFVELRHQATHEQLPSLTRLRISAQKALDWIWHYYWRHLPDITPVASAEPASPAQVEAPPSAQDDGCREALVRCLEMEDQGEREALVGEVMGMYEVVEVLTALDKITGATTQSGILRRAFALTREVMDKTGANSDRMEEDGGRLPRDVESVRAELGKAWMEVKELEVVDGDQGSEQHGEGDEMDVEEDRLPSWSMYDQDTWVPKPIGVV